MAFEFCHDDATQESYLAIVLALFECFNTKNLWVCSTLTNMNSLPMGVIALDKSSFAFFTFLGKISSVTRPALPMGVAPEAIVEKMFRV
jgi:hypothetical protein